MSDLTFQEFSDAANNCATIEGGNVHINVSLLIGETVDDLSDLKVFEFLGKALKAAYEAQEEKNESLPVGQKLGAVSEPSSNVPAFNETGAIVATTEFSLRLIHALDLDNPSAPLS